MTLSVACPLGRHSGSCHLGNASAFVGDMFLSYSYYYKRGFFEQQNIIFSQLWGLESESKAACYCRGFFWFPEAPGVAHPSSIVPILATIFIGPLPWCPLCSLMCSLLRTLAVEGRAIWVLQGYLILRCCLDVFPHKAVFTGPGAELRSISSGILIHPPAQPVTKSQAGKVWYV